MSIDWMAQWAQFAPGFEEGKAYIDLSPYGKEIKFPLIPGAGFGDFSHPTTQMSLELLGQEAAGRSVVDLGSGSGILSIAAHYLGALSIIGVEIEEEAIAHAEANASLNGIEISFIPLLKHFPPNSLIVMNMISSEQEVLLPFLPKGPHTLIASGIIDLERESYVKRKIETGYTLLKEIQSGCWLAFLFSK